MMEMIDMLKVIFRALDRENKRTPKGKAELDDIMAIFPQIHEGPNGEPLSYVHFGQHSYCNLSFVKDHSRAATEEESEDLRKELVDIGYAMKREYKNE